MQYCKEAMFREFVVYYKSNEPVKLFDIEPVIIQNFDYKTLLNTNSKIFKPNTDIIPDTYFTSKLKNTQNESLLILIPLLRDKCYQLYKVLMEPLEKNLEQAQFLVNNNIREFPGCNAPKEQVMSSLLKTLGVYIKSYFLYAKDLPGFNKLCIEDLDTIHKEYCILVFTLFSNKLYINNECYLIFGDVQLTKKLMSLFVGNKAINYIFNFHKKLRDLNMTGYELSLLSPFLLTSTGKFIYFSNFNFVYLFNFN